MFYTGYRIGVYAVLTICLVGVVSSLRTGCSARVWPVLSLSYDEYNSYLTFFLIGFFYYWIFGRLRFVVRGNWSVKQSNFIVFAGHNLFWFS